MPIPSCNGCSLADKGRGFVPPDGSEYSDICFIGESPGGEEITAGKPFVGPAGGKLMSIMKRLQIQRDDVRIHNTISCQPPENKLAGTTYERDAIWHCGKNLEPVLREPHKVFIAVGAVPAKRLLGLSKYNVNNFHGTVNIVDGRYIVPTYHPSFLLRGNQKLTGVVCFDITQAKRIASGQWKPQPATLRVDPDLEWFTQWVDTYLQALSSGLDTWLSVDVETVEKMRGGAEDELDGSQTQIVRINFAYHPDEGVTVPFLGGYLDQVRRLLESNAVKIFHNHRYDCPLLRQAGFRINPQIHDSMNLWKYAQSDLPQGLGFIAPFYSSYMYPPTQSTAWKHLSGEAPGDYAAIDAFQTLRIAYGIKRDLLKAGIWNTYLRHVYDLDTYVLHPAEEVGLYVDRAKLAAFREQLVVKEDALEAKIKSQVDEDFRPLCSGGIDKETGLRKPGKGWKKAPKPEALRLGEELIEREILMEVLCCSDCGAKEVTPKHKCKKPKEPKIVKPKKPRKSRKAGAGLAVVAGDEPASSDRPSST
jgi:uracil-DNA glycosylase family 4